LLKVHGASLAQTTLALVSLNHLFIICKHKEGWRRRERGERGEERGGREERREGKRYIPLHLLTIEAAEILKKVVLDMEATALASMVLPVPGGPYNKIPFHGVSKPVNNLQNKN
jgi:hypothetical protein